MEHPAGVDPPADDAARCDRYTSSDKGEDRPAPTTDDRVAGKRPMAVESTSAGAAPTGAAAGPVMGQGRLQTAKRPSAAGLLELSMMMTRRRRPRPWSADLATAPTSHEATLVRLLRIRLPCMLSRHDQEERRRRRRLGVLGDWSSLWCTEALTYKFIRKNFLFREV